MLNLLTSVNKRSCTGSSGSFFLNNNNNNPLLTSLFRSYNNTRIFTSLLPSTIVSSLCKNNFYYSSSSSSSNYKKSRVSSIGVRKSDRTNDKSSSASARSSGDRSRDKYSKSSSPGSSSSGLQKSSNIIRNKKLLHPISSSKEFKSQNKFTNNNNNNNKSTTTTSSLHKSKPITDFQSSKVIVEKPDDDVTVIQSKSTFSDGMNPEQHGSGQAFSKLGLTSTLVQSLKEVNITIPSTIQQLAIPEILSKKSDVLFVSQTGTGKTLSYLLPVFQNIKLTEEKEKQQQVEVKDDKVDNSNNKSSSTSERLPGRPRAIILVPTRELVRQVCQVTKQLAHHHKLSCAGISRGGGENAKHLKGFKERSVDIVVSTPGVLIQLIESKQIFFGHLEYLVVDEADSMFTNGKGFDEDMKKILAPIEYRLMNKNIPNYKAIYSIICSATLTEQLMLTIKSLFPDISKISTPYIHKSLNTLEQQFITVKGGDKHEALLRSVQPSQSKKILVFCNSADSCRSTEHFLNENGYSVTSLHGDIPSKLRQNNWKEFQAGEKRILVCTDIASRGIDNKQVDHVVLFDFPSNPIDYLHRIGRTARAGQRGVVTCIIGKRDQVLANAIQEALKRGDSLESLSSNKRLNKY